MTGMVHWTYKFMRRHRPATLGMIIVTGIVLIALVGPWVVSRSPDEVFPANQSPNATHWLGTDSQGYDLMTRMVYGSQTTLRIALLATLMSIGLGTSIGAIAGYVGGKIDMLLMRLVDFAMSFPSFLLAMVTVAVLGKQLNNVIYAVGLVGAPMFARQMRAEVIRVVSMDFILAARATGVSESGILWRHVLPNSAGPIIVLGTLGLGSAILDVAGLNFLGLGGDPYKVPEWGLILNQGWQEIQRGTLQVTVAGISIFVTVLGLNLLGDGLRDELDPKSGHRA